MPTLKDTDKLIELIDDDIALLNDDISSLDFVGMSREGYDVCLCTLNMVKQYIKALPTIDAEPVVRCKDCKYAKKYMMSYGYKCTWDGLARNSFDFCSDGARMDGGENG